ncbi:MAG TPA: hypothetical protein DFS52_00550 [Myxococcales bacterium]|nr:hypothetical protein [Myxococcales bacterium]
MPPRARLLPGARSALAQEGIEGLGRKRHQLLGLTLRRARRRSRATADTVSPKDAFDASSPTLCRTAKAKASRQVEPDVQRAQRLCLASAVAHPRDLRSPEEARQVALLEAHPSAFGAMLGAGDRPSPWTSRKGW